jgi:hypothetical protein
LFRIVVFVFDSDISRLVVIVVLVFKVITGGRGEVSVAPGDRGEGVSLFVPGILHEVVVVGHIW